MARNIEVKARIESVTALLPKAAALADKGPFHILQDDPFFPCASGRLKLRSFSRDDGELIFYRRADLLGPTESFYIRSRTSAPGALRESLALAYGTSGRVQKYRTLFMVGRTRIHLDRVEGLGDFLELEVVLGKSESTEEGMKTAQALMEKLGVQKSQLVEASYIDMLAQQEAGR